LSAIAWQNMVLQEGEDCFAGLACMRYAYALTGMRSESAEQLNGLGFVGHL